MGDSDTKPSHEDVTVYVDGEPRVIEGWAECAVLGCSNKRCLALDSPYCYPHTEGPKGSDRIGAET